MELMSSAGPGADSVVQQVAPERLAELGQSAVFVFIIPPYQEGEAPVS